MPHKYTLLCYSAISYKTILKFKILYVKPISKLVPKFSQCHYFRYVVMSLA